MKLWKHLSFLLDVCIGNLPYLGHFLFLSRRSCYISLRALRPSIFLPRDPLPSQLPSFRPLSGDLTAYLVKVFLLTSTWHLIHILSMAALRGTYLKTAPASRPPFHQAVLRRLSWRTCRTLMGPECHFLSSFCAWSEWHRNVKCISRPSPESFYQFTLPMRWKPNFLWATLLDDFFFNAKVTKRNNHRFVCRYLFSF